MVANKGAQDDPLFDVKHRALRRGDVASFSGTPGKTKSGQVSLFASDASILAPCLHDIPEKFTDPERRVRERHLDLLVNDQVHKSLRLRAKVIRFVRNFLDERGFLEVETPILSAKAGGAHARPFVTRSNALDEDLHMRIAPELYLKQLVIGGIDRVYEIGKVFRNEGVDATHNPEFTSCEFYQAYSSFDELTKLTEDLVSQLVLSVHGTLKVRVPSKNAQAAAPGEDITSTFPLVDFTPPFQRLSFMDTLEEKMGTKLPHLDSPDAIPTLLHLCRKHGLSTEGPHTLAILLDRLAGEFIEPLCVNPTFLMNHPLAMSPLAKKHPAEPSWSSRFELFVAKQEICNAYTELNSPDEQRERFVEQMRDRDLGDAEAPPTDEDFCRALEYGLPPSVGWGMGIDRMVMLLAQTPHIRNVLAFPLARTQKPDSVTEGDGPAGGAE